MSLLLDIITPEKVVFKGEADEVIIPTTRGQIAVLSNHANLLSQIQEGELTIRLGKEESHLAITSGFLEVADNKVTILADYAVRSEHIEAQKALEAKKRAEELMKQAKERTNQKDFAIAENELRRALLELKVVTKRKPLKNIPS